jgi:hypothetical protein
VLAIGVLISRIEVSPIRPCLLLLKGKRLGATFALISIINKGYGASLILEEIEVPNIQTYALLVRHLMTVMGIKVKFLSK